MRWLLALALAVGCTSTPDVKEFAGTEMTIPYRILVAGPVRDDVKGILCTTFEEIDRVYNNWNPKSEVSRLNGLRAHEVVHLSPEMATFLKRVDQLVRKTDGLFDPTVGSKEGTGWNRVRVAGGLFCKEHDRTALDFGGIAKGYCVDLLVERLVSAGYESVYVSWGGEVRTAGRHPKGRPWTVAVALPGRSEPATTLPLENRAVATSGDYLQLSQGNDGALYTHIIDPRTLRPLRVERGSVASVTVTAETCMEADALATAAMIARSLEEKAPDSQFFFLTRS